MLALEILDFFAHQTCLFSLIHPKEVIIDSLIFKWIDVRDLALAHVKAIELPQAADKRFFITAGYFSNKEVCEIIRKNFPNLEKELPSKDIKGGDYPEGTASSL